VFDVTTGTPVPMGSVFTGLDPVSARFRTTTEVWVVNHVSDSVSVVDLPTMRVRATLATRDEPCDVVFAGSPVRAFVSCSQADAVMAFDPTNLAAPPLVVPIDAEDPRALAVSPDGTKVYAAVFESGNGSTVLGGGALEGLGFPVGFFPPNVVDDPGTPHNGQNPPPNDGFGFDPPQDLANPLPPEVALIVKKDAAGAWRDDTGGDWTAWVSGASAAASGRPPGWDLPDRDVAVIDATTLAVTYVPRLMNTCMALAVNPATGRIAVVGTDATNEVRFEPVISGTFLRVRLALVDPASPGTPALVDLNPHLDYSTPNVPQATRNRSIGDPRGVAWNAAGTRAYVVGMGSGNLVVLDATGAPVGSPSVVPLGAGPSGLALDEGRSRLYVWNRFDGTISVVDTAGPTETARVPLFDPTPPVIRTGRSHLYDTHRTSGLGHIACASCHVDARMDRLAWDLGDPSGAVKNFDQNCFTGAVTPCQHFHPMKGPMTTQTLQDIVGHEPFHWRGDRDGLEEFNGAFMSLQGDDVGLTSQQLQEYEDFLATITFPPNPFRNLDNTLPSSLPLPGHFTTGRFGPAGLPLPVGNAQTGLVLYRTGSLDGGLAGANCSSCHTLPTGLGSENRVTLGLGGPTLSPPLPVGPFGERHLALVSVDGQTNVSMKVPQLRNMYEKVGFEATQPSNRAGFGFLHDGAVDSIARFVSEPVFGVTSDQQVADLVAFMLAFSGSELPAQAGGVFDAPGPAGRDSHAAVGRQATIASPSGATALLDTMLALAQGAKVDVVVKSLQGGVARGWFYDRSTSRFLADRDGDVITPVGLRGLAAPGSEETWTVVPLGLGRRLGIDRDGDGFGDTTEVEAGSNPADQLSTP
jgi:YVTN family beta-propeller protein